MAGHDSLIASLAFQYLGCLDEHTDGGVYLAGSCVTHNDFAEGAATSAVNAACAALHRVGWGVRDCSPLTMARNLYDYSQRPAGAN